MPSPVSRSDAATASPANSARPPAAVAGISSTRAGIGQARCGPSGSRVGSQVGSHVRPGQQVGPQLGHVADRVAAAAVDAEAHVGPAVRQRERPEVAGQEVGLERHEERPAGLGADRREVLAEGVGLAEVAGAGRAELLAHGRPHAVGGHDVAGLDPSPSSSVEPDVVRARLGRGHHRSRRAPRPRPCGPRRGARRRGPDAAPRRRSCRRGGSAKRVPATGRRAQHAPRPPPSSWRPRSGRARGPRARAARPW